MGIPQPSASHLVELPLRVRTAILFFLLSAGRDVSRPARWNVCLQVFALHRSSSWWRTQIRQCPHRITCTNAFPLRKEKGPSSSPCLAQPISSSLLGSCSVILIPLSHPHSLPWTSHPKVGNNRSFARSSFHLYSCPYCHPWYFQSFLRFQPNSSWTSGHCPLWVLPCRFYHKRVLRYFLFTCLDYKNSTEQSHLTDFRLHIHLAALKPR